MTNDTLEVGYNALTNPDPAGDNWFFLGKGKCPVPPSQCADVTAKQEAYDNGDLRYDSLYYEWLNGTEGNFDDITMGGRADKEQLTRTAFVTAGSYFSYVVDFDQDTLDNEYYVPESDKNGWRTYRIPIKDSLATDTMYTASGIDPDWDEIVHIRVWFDDDGIDPLRRLPT